MLKCKQRLGIKKQFIMNRKRDANSNWYSSEVMKCRKLITATKASRIKPCERTIRNLYIYIFYEEQHSGIALLLDRDEKNICCLVHTNAMNLCSLFSKKRPPKWDVLIYRNTDGVLEVRKSVTVLPVFRTTVAKTSWYICYPSWAK